MTLDELVEESPIGSENVGQSLNKTNSLVKKEYSTIGDILEYYFKPKASEKWRDGLIYKLLGVSFFKKIVPTLGSYVTRLIGFRPFADASDRKEALKFWEPWTRVYETMHTVSLAICSPSIVEKIAEGDLTSSTIISNLLINIYPIMLQRYNRARIYNALEEK